MTATEKILVTQLRDSLLENFGSIKRFCRITQSRYTPIVRFLSGEGNWDDRLYEALDEQVKGAKTNISSEIILLEQVIQKYFGGYQEFCKSTGVKKATLTRVMGVEMPSESKEFIRVSWLAYSKALHQIENIHESINSMTPAKYLRKERQRNRNLQKIADEDLASYRRLHL